MEKQDDDDKGEDDLEIMLSDGTDVENQKLNDEEDQSEESKYEAGGEHEEQY